MISISMSRFSTSIRHCVYHSKTWSVSLTETTVGNGKLELGAVPNV